MASPARRRLAGLSRLRALKAGVLRQRLKSKATRAKPQSQSGSGDLKAASPTSRSSIDRSGSFLRDVAAVAAGLSETFRRNVALEAVREGNYFVEAEQQHELLDWLRYCYECLFLNEKFMRKNRAKMSKENGLTKLYDVDAILAKRHEEDGYNIFVHPDEAVRMFEAEKAKAARAASGLPNAFSELDPDSLAELQETFELLCDAASGSADPLDDAEVVEFLEKSASAGECMAAVFAAEQLCERYDGRFPDAEVDAAFNALKPLLRPSARRATPHLELPEDLAAGRKKLTSALGKVLDQLAKQRREAAVAQGGEAAEDAAKQAQGAEELERLTAILAPTVLQDSAARACNRRASLAVEVVRICQTVLGWEISAVLAHAVISELERLSFVKASGRDLELTAKTAKEPASAEVQKLRDSAETLALLQRYCKERLQKRKQRQQSRKQSKRRRTD